MPLAARHQVESGNHLQATASCAISPLGLDSQQLRRIVEMETHPPQARRAKKLLLVAVAALWALPSQASGDINGFLREKRHGDVAFSFSDESFDRFWLGSTK